MVCGPLSRGNFFDKYATLHTKDGPCYFSLARFAPACLSADWFSTSDELRKAARLATPTNKIDLEVFRILDQLQQEVDRLERDLEADMKGGRSGAQLAKYAFRTIGNEDAKGNPAANDWHHRILLVFLRDRLTWAAYGDLEEDDRPYQMPLGSFLAPSDTTGDFRKLYLEWPTTVKRVAKEWRSLSSDAPVPASNAAVGSEGAGFSLWQGYKNSRTKSKKFNVLGNFAAAALALCALRHVSQLSVNGVRP